MVILLSISHGKKQGNYYYVVFYIDELDSQMVEFISFQSKFELKNF